MEDSYNNINLSAVLSLKTELLRKKKDVAQLKIGNTLPKGYDIKTSELKYKNATTSNDKESNANKKRQGDVADEDDARLLAKSQKILQAKARFYERMMESKAITDADMSNSLIVFERKASLNHHRKEDRISDSEDEGNFSFQDEVEYIDEFGRTRKCSREEFKSIQNGSFVSKNTVPASPIAEDPSDAHSVIGENDLTESQKEQEIRMRWEEKTRENAHKEEVHYQDVFFDEARQHGVGYYGFSTDDSERHRQQKELESLRQKTLQEQEERSSQRALRESINSKRVLAAKNRKRARLGLPSLPDEEVVSAKSKKEETTTEPEPEPDIDRSQYNRPWDKNKTTTDTDWFVKSERRLPYSQGEWNELKRKERKAEFAPPQTDAPKRNSKNFIERRAHDQSDIELAIEAKLYNIRNATNT